MKQELELKLHFRHFPELQAKLSVHELELEVELELDLELERKLELGSKLEPELDLAPEPELHFRHAPELQAELSVRCASSQEPSARIATFGSVSPPQIGSGPE